MRNTMHEETRENVIGGTISNLGYPEQAMLVTTGKPTGVGMRTSGVFGRLLYFRSSTDTNYSNSGGGIVCHDFSYERKIPKQAKFVIP